MKPFENIVFPVIRRCASTLTTSDLISVLPMVYRRTVDKNFRLPYKHHFLIREENVFHIPIGDQVASSDYILEYNVEGELFKWASKKSIIDQIDAEDLLLEKTKEHGINGDI